MINESIHICLVKVYNNWKGHSIFGLNFSVPYCLNKVANQKNVNAIIFSNVFRPTDICARKSEKF